MISKHAVSYLGCNFIIVNFNFGISGKGLMEGIFCPYLISKKIPAHGRFFCIHNLVRAFYLNSYIVRLYVDVVKFIVYGVRKNVYVEALVILTICYNLYNQYSNSTISNNYSQLKNLKLAQESNETFVKIF